MASNSTPLLDLPVELQSTILSFLPNRDIKNLRLTCRALSATSKLRLDRVFLSANHRNIDVFRAIADHEVFRAQVVEIVWDDGRLNNYQSPPPPADAFSTWRARDVWRVAHECPRAFLTARDASLRAAMERPDKDDAVLSRLAAHRLAPAHAWRYYQELVRQQRDVLETDADESAFRHGLERFPRLRRVTITSALNGGFFEPAYETPMIRAFPADFQYPAPTLLCSRPTYKRYIARPWMSMVELSKSRWRGFRSVTRELALNRHHNVIELVLDPDPLFRLNCTVFSEPCAEYENFATLLKRPGFRRLDLDLGVFLQPMQGWSAFRSGLLRRALAEASSLEHISLRTDQSRQSEDHLFNLFDDHHSADLGYVPLRSIFPVDRWPRLRHFGLSNMRVHQEDLVAFLAALPATLRSIELSCLTFLQGSYGELLVSMRDSLDWRTRSPGERPKVTIELVSMDDEGRSLRVNEMEDFLYGDGPHPLRTQPDMSPA